MPPIDRVRLQVDKRGTQVSQAITSMALSRMSALIGGDPHSALANFHPVGL